MREPGSLSWPTLTATSYGSGGNGSGNGNTTTRNKPSLQTMARNGWLPTLTIKGNYNRKGASKKSGDWLATVLGGTLNPTWLEWYQGFSAGWTEVFEREP